MNDSSTLSTRSATRHQPRLWRLSGWFAALGCVVLLFSVSVSKSGQNIGGGLLLLAFLFAGIQVWRDALQHRLVWATFAWIAAITASMLYAAIVVGIPLDEQTTHLWRFSRLFLIPLVAWGVAFSGLGAYRAYMILFAGFAIGTLYHMATHDWPWFFSTPGRIDISGENVQFYGLLSATVLIAALIFGGTVHHHVANTIVRLGFYVFWAIVLLAAVQGLFISLARGSFLGLAVVAAVWATLSGRRALQRGSLKWTHAVATAAVAASIAASMVYSGLSDDSLTRAHTDVKSLMAGPDPETGLFLDSSIGVRLNQWRVALETFPDHKLLGHGPDGSRFVRAAADLPGRSGTAAPHHFHSIYIDLLIRFGILGTIVITWFTVEYVRALRHATPDTNPPIVLFSTFALILFLVAGLTQSYWTSQVTWFYLAAVFGPACAGIFNRGDRGDG